LTLVSPTSTLHNSHPASPVTSNLSTLLINFTFYLVYPFISSIITLLIVLSSYLTLSYPLNSFLLFLYPSTAILILPSIYHYFNLFLILSNLTFVSITLFLSYIPLLMGFLPFLTLQYSHLPLITYSKLVLICLLHYLYFLLISLFLHLINLISIITH